MSTSVVASSPASPDPSSAAPLSHSTMNFHAQQPSSADSGSSKAQMNGVGGYDNSLTAVSALDPAPVDVVMKGLKETLPHHPDEVADSNNGDNLTSLSDREIKASAELTEKEGEDCDGVEGASASPPQAQDVAVTEETKNACVAATAPLDSKGWRAKLYRLITDGSWDDCGTGYVTCAYCEETGHQTLCMRDEGEEGCLAAGKVDGNLGGNIIRVLLRTRILLRDAYQRQGENIIIWCEPSFGLASPVSSASDASIDEAEQDSGGVDLALSFQENAGCLEIWKQIAEVQEREVMGTDDTRQHRAPLAVSVHDVQEDAIVAGVPTDSAATVEGWSVQYSPEDAIVAGGPTDSAAAVEGWSVQYSPYTMAALSGAYGMSETASLPSPSVDNIEDIADAVTNAQLQRDSLAMRISADDCSYVKELLALLPVLEAADPPDPPTLAALAATVKALLLLNDPVILELLTASSDVFVGIAGVLEYDPDLRVKAEHRVFLRERARFRTVIPMEDEELISSIHRSFRINYLKDTILRPLTDESALSTLNSMLIFSHAEVVRRVATKDGYLINILKLLSHELSAIREAEASIESEAGLRINLDFDDESMSVIDVGNNINRLKSSILPTDDGVVRTGDGNNSCYGMWDQHLISQISSLEARRSRRRGCLLFLKELFGMVRALQPSARDDFYSLVIPQIDPIEPNVIAPHSPGADGAGSTSSKSSLASGDEPQVAGSCGPVCGAIISEKNPKDEEPQPQLNLLALLTAILSDERSDVAEKDAALEILAATLLYDPNLLRRHVMGCSARPNKPSPDEEDHVYFATNHNDLLLALIRIIACDRDTGILLQTCEVFKMALDTESTEGGDRPSQFLATFYERYVQWLVVPFQYRVGTRSARSLGTYGATEKCVENNRECVSAISAKFPSRTSSLSSHRRENDNFELKDDDELSWNTSYSFMCELLCFCVKAHCYRMKFFVVRNGVLGKVLRLLSMRNQYIKLASLRFLRAVVSIKDELYNRYIEKHDIFAPVFEAFRKNAVKDNLVSSAIIEMCEYIRAENIKTLLSYIVNKYMTAESSLLLEAIPYVDTFTLLRQQYEDNQAKSEVGSDDGMSSSNGTGSGYFPDEDAAAVRRLSVMGVKVIEDQRKFREAGEEDSYFNDDEDDVVTGSTMEESGASNTPGEIQHTHSFIGLYSTSSVPRPPPALPNHGLVQYGSDEDEAPLLPENPIRNTEQAKKNFNDSIDETIDQVRKKARVASGKDLAEK